MASITKFHCYFVVILVAILQISGVKGTNEELRCPLTYSHFSYEEIYMVLWELFGVENHTVIVDYIESNKNTEDAFYRGAICSICSANATAAECDGIIRVIGICTEASSDPADCAAVALYNGVECNSASWCLLWYETVGLSTATLGSFSANCSGISSNFPTCTLACEGNLTTAEACMGDNAPVSNSPTNPPTPVNGPTNSPTPVDSPTNSPTPVDSPTNSPTPDSPTNAPVDSGENVDDQSGAATTMAPNGVLVGAAISTLVSLLIMKVSHRHRTY